MFATFISVFILLGSVAFLFSLLRAASRAALRQTFERDYSADVAEGSQLEFLAVRRALLEYPEEIADYSGVLTTLQRDYEALTYLLRNAGTVHVGKYSRAERLLMLDFQLLRFWVRVERNLGLQSWHSALLEMTSILRYFGNVMGQRLTTSPLF